MTDYPEALIRKVAAAAARGVDDTTDLYGADRTWPADYIHEHEQGAVAVLDALGFAPYHGTIYWRSAIHVEASK